MAEGEPEPEKKVEGETTSATPTEKESDPAPQVSVTKDDKPTDTILNSLDTTPRKVVVHNVFKFLNKKDLDKIVKSWLDDAAKPDGFKLVIERYRKPPRNGWIVVTLAEESMVEPFIKLINGTKRENKRGQVMVAHKAGNEPGKRNKRSRDGNGDNADNKRARPDVPARPTPSQIRAKLTALWTESYPTQMETKKKDMIRNCAWKIEKELKNKFRTLEKEARRDPNKKVPKVFSWMKEKPGIDVEEVIRSPLVTKYRNKCELTFGYRCPDDSEKPIAEEEKQENEKEGTENTEEAKKIPSLGFLPYGWRHSVCRPHSLQNVPDEVCAIADLIDGFLPDSPLLPYENGVHRGFWRSITIRSSERTGQVMIIVVHASPEGAAGEEKSADDASETAKKEKRALFEKERDRLVSILTKDKLPIPKRDLPTVKMVEESDASKDVEMATGDEESAEKKDDASKDETTAFCVSSIFFQEYNGLSNPSVSHPVQHVYGSKYIEEKLGKNTYQISPGAFFQVTTAGAEILYNVVADRLKEVGTDPGNTLMFDVCCGTGTIGLHCISEGVVGKVVGIDISEPAIDDALANAIRNGYGDEESKGKTRFVASRAELVMGQELRRANSGSASDRPRSIVAVVDPARDGLHPDVIKAIRSTKEIQRLVYVSCNPTGSLVNDTANLCCPPSKKYRGLPFKPTRAQPVDMFPLTPHCEMVMTFDRMTEEEVKGEAQKNTASSAKQPLETTEEKQEEKIKVEGTEDSDSKKE